MANEAFDSTMEITEDSANAAKEKIVDAVGSMEEQFNGMKDKLDPPKVEEIQAKFKDMKDSLAALGEKSGAELVAALGEIKTKGAELAGELTALKEQVMGNGATEEGAAAEAPAADETPAAE